MNWLRRNNRAILTSLAAVLTLTCLLPPSKAEDVLVSRLRFASASTTIAPWVETVPLRAGIGRPRFMMRSGGVAFAATLTVPARFAGATIRPEYDATRPDGERLVVRLNGIPYVVKDVPDRWLAPIIFFADASTVNNQVLVTLTPDDDDHDLVAPNRPLTVVHEARVHEAIKARELGQRLIALDMLFDPTDESPAVKSGRAKFDELAVRQMIADKAPIGSWLIHDVGTTISFQVQGSELIPTGRPHFFFWGVPDEDEDDGNRKPLPEKIKPAQPLSDMVTREQESLLKGNPGYRAGLATMRLAALFRHVKSQAPEAWHAFLTRMRPIAAAEPAVPTDYVVDTRLEKWVADFPEASRGLERLRAIPDEVDRFLAFGRWMRDHKEAIDALARIESDDTP